MISVLYRQQSEVVTSTSPIQCPYKQWVSFYTDVQINHMLQDPGFPTIEILQVYGHRDCHKHYFKQLSIQSDLVATVWYNVAKT